MAGAQNQGDSGGQGADGNGTVRKGISQVPVPIYAYSDLPGICQAWHKVLIFDRGHDKAKSSSS